MLLKSWAASYLSCPLGKHKWDTGKINTPNYISGYLLSSEISLYHGATEIEIIWKIVPVTQLALNKN